MQGYKNLFKCLDKSCIDVTLQVQGYFPPDTTRLAAGCRLRLLLLLAGANPEKASRQAGRQAGCWRLGLAESRSYIHQRPTQRIACYSLISTEARARTYTPPQIEGESQAGRDGGRVDRGNR